jgi:hypothetical protein
MDFEPNLRLAKKSRPFAAQIAGKTIAQVFV